MSQECIELAANLSQKMRYLSSICPHDLYLDLPNPIMTNQQNDNSKIFGKSFYKVRNLK